MVVDLAPGSASGLPSNGAGLHMSAIAGRLWFTATDGSTGIEPWVTDGTAAGTQLVADLVPGAAGSTPRLFTAYGSRVVFSAPSSAEPTSSSLWISDGTPPGPHEVVGWRRCPR